MKTLCLLTDKHSTQTFALSLGFVLLCYALLIPSAYASEDGWFAADSLYFYNPLKTSGGSRSYHVSTTGMNDEALLQAAQDHKDSSMNATHRALNHQWLSQSGNDDVRGGKVLSKILKMGFKTYWNSIKHTKFRSNKLIPDGSGTGKVKVASGGDIDYKLRLSGHKLNMSVQYDF